MLAASHPDSDATSDIASLPDSGAAALAAPAGLMHLGPRPPQIFTRGQGAWLWDSTGRRHLDWVQGWAVNTLGHAPPELARALADQAGTLLQAGPGFHNDRAIALAQRLAALTGFDRAFIGSTGAEANEAAVKLARKWGRLHKGGAATVLSFEGSFHGRTLAMMAASGKPGFGAIFPPAVPGFRHLPYNRIDGLEAALAAPDVVAVLVECVQGEAGVVPAELHFLATLQALCRQHRVLLVVDEVQTGIGRCGSLLAHTQWALAPDIVTLGKGLGGGMPVSAMLAREAVCCFAPGDQGGTFHGNALACAAALAVLEVVAAPGFLSEVQARGRQLAAGLQALAARHALAGLAGRGLMQALLLPPGLPSALLADAARVPDDPARDALLVNPAQPQRLRLMPALNSSAEEITHGLRLLDDALQAVTQPAH